MDISSEDRQALLTLARTAVDAAVSGRPLPKVEHAQDLLSEFRGCFVTLKNHGRLRGCIGQFEPTHPLGQLIVQMAKAAATEDFRFAADPVTPAELPDLTVEVSVLSPLTKTTDPQDLRVGVDGIYIIHGPQRGCFLPEVATDMGWDAQEFLSQCCAGKAGLAPDAWRDPEAKVYLFTSEKFSE